VEEIIYELTDYSPGGYEIFSMIYFIFPERTEEKHKKS
jgi:hypothetical protein